MFMDKIMGTPVLNVNRFSGFVPSDNTGMSIGSRIKQARKHSGLTQAQLASKTGLNQSTISDLEVGKSHGSSFVASMAAALGVDPLWLESGKGQMLQSVVISTPEDDHLTSGSPFLRDQIPVKIREESSLVQVKLVKLKLQAGYTGFQTQVEPEDDSFQGIPLSVVDELHLNVASLLAVRIRGQSMEPMIFEGDIVVLDTSDRKPVSRECFAVNWDGEACVKMLVKRNVEWYLHSVNPDFPPVNVRSGQCDIIGRVVYQPGRILTGRL
jgi:phage repressor protein C with HTH and peptisase S24 domain